MKLVQLEKTVWINVDQLTYYDEKEQYLHFTDGHHIKVSNEVFKKLILGLKATTKKKAEEKTAGN